MAFHFIVRFAPQPGKEREFREALLGVIEPSRAEAGCLSIHAFESPDEPHTFAIHSTWTDEAAFETHAQLPHTLRFLEAAERLLTHQVQGFKSRQIAGGTGAAAAVQSRT